MGFEEKINMDNFNENKIFQKVKKPIIIKSAF